MNKLVYCVATVAFFGLFVGCKSKQSAYRAAYERAQPQTNTPAQDVEEEFVLQTPTAKHDGSAVKVEKVEAVNPQEAPKLMKYSVVVGSFINLTNATALKDHMVDLGYPALLAKNENNMYRVLVASYSDKADAVLKRDMIKSKYAPQYADAWILENAR